MRVQNATVASPAAVVYGEHRRQWCRLGVPLLDRRQHPRHPVLLKAVLSVGRDRRDVICTQIGPSGAFFSSRPDGLEAGKAVEVSLRAAADGPSLSLGAIIVRVVAAGSVWPLGFAVRWTTVSCSQGTEGLATLMAQLLHVVDIAAADLDSSPFDLATWLAQRPLRPTRPAEATAPQLGLRDATSSARWEAGMGTPTPHDFTTGRPDSTVRMPTLLPPRPTATAAASGATAAEQGLALGWRGAASDSHPHGNDEDEDDATPSIPAPTSPEIDVAARIAREASVAAPTAEPSTVFDSTVEASSSIDTDARTSVSNDAFSQSWPVYALSPGERRDPTTVGKQVPALSTRNFDMGAEKTEVDVAVLPQLSQIGEAPLAVPHQAVVRRSARTTSAAANHVMRRTRTAVRYSCGAGSFDGTAVSIGRLAVAVVTRDPTPLFDEQVTVHLPLDTPLGPVTAHLHGRLLQIAETEQGPRFVLHIERADDSASPDAFARMLEGLQR